MFFGILKKMPHTKVWKRTKKKDLKIYFRPTILVSLFSFFTIKKEFTHCLQNLYEVVKIHAW